MLGIGHSTAQCLPGRKVWPIGGHNRCVWISGKHQALHLTSERSPCSLSKASLGTPLPCALKRFTTRKARVARCSPVAKGVSLFPAGKQQAKVKLPALLLRVATSDVLNGIVTEIVSQGVQGGATAVVLTEDKGATSGAGDLYDAALKLQDLIRGRASLFIEDRTDISNAVDADGVLMTSRGVPLAVARRTLEGKSALLGQFVETVEEAVRAAADGASFVVFGTADGSPPDLEDVKNAKASQKGGSIPVIPQYSTGGISDLGSLLKSGIDGVSLDPMFLSVGALACGASGKLTSGDAAGIILEALSTQDKSGLGESTTGRRKVAKGRESLIMEEKLLIDDITRLLDKVSPEMEEKSLLDGAVKQLDELFMVVVVGEFNSGKSSVINALLGRDFLEEGILPTTNEVSVLRYAPNKKASSKPNADGFVERYLPAKLLREIAIVDTPGTNVILDRQQRLTEEYVPRADMILFVMSADRPFTESEVKFLEYIRKWGKKVVFVVNKVDILNSGAQVDEVKTFVGNNAKKLLSLDEAFVWPVSAKKALGAKQQSGEDLEGDPNWKESRFQELESFVFGFFEGAGGESIRLKLQTPLAVADALLDACRRQLSNELGAAEKDLAAVRAVREQLKAFQEEMRKDSVVQRRAVRDLLDKIVSRIEEFVDDTLQLSNAQTLRGYLSSSSQNGNGDTTPELTKGLGPAALGTAVDDLRLVVDEHDSWLKKNLDIQVGNYRSFAEKCIKPKGLSLEVVMADHQKLRNQNGAGEPESPKVLQRNDTIDDEAPESEDDDTETVSSIMKKVMSNPDLGLELCECLMESEIRGAVNATTGTAVAAIGIGIVLTLVLPYTSEDFLALALSLVIGYVALLNLPLRRGEVKGKVRRVSTEIFKELDGTMDNSLEETLDECSSEVMGMVEPLEMVFEADVQQVKDAESNRTELATELETFKARVANLE